MKAEAKSGGGSKGSDAASRVRHMWGHTRIRAPIIYIECWARPAFVKNNNVQASSKTVTVLVDRPLFGRPASVFSRAPWDWTQGIAPTLPEPLPQHSIRESGNSSGR